MCVRALRARVHVCVSKYLGDTGFFAVNYFHELNVLPYTQNGRRVRRIRGKLNKPTG